MKKIKSSWAKKSLCGRAMRRLLGDEKGAVAMEYIVIALLVAAAVVGLVMVFGGNLRNMFDKTNSTLTATKVEEVKEVGTAHRQEQEALKGKNDIAVEAGNKLGGDFTDARKKASSGSGSGN